jgi:Spy/CpxP family protein refolding chaperone
MSKTRPLLAAIAALVLASGAARAADKAAAAAPQSQESILLDTIRANRKALVAVNLELSDEQAGKFWPLYDKYQKELNAVGDRVAAVIDDYSKNFHDLSDDKAAKLMDQYLAAEAERVQVRRDYLPEFQKILPGRTVARLYQIENKMDAVLRYELAAAIPVVEEKPAPAK